MSNEAPRVDDETSETDERRRVPLSTPGRLELKKTVETGQVRQSFSHGRTKAVTVEVKKRRTFKPTAAGRMAEVKPRVEAKPAAPSRAPAAEFAPAPRAAPAAPSRATVDTAAPARPALVLRSLTEEEKEARTRAVEQARKSDAEARKHAEERARRDAEEEARRGREREAAAQRQAEEE
ncbi:MAG: translation initiation factor IF-2 associated domain-containing protein, partial [Alphaproteobacteria bacterium]